MLIFTKADWVIDYKISLKLLVIYKIKYFQKKFKKLLTNE